MSVARLTKLTAPLEEQLLQALRTGATRTDVAGYIGVDRGTLARWLRRNAAFCRKVEQAEAVAAVRCTTIITKAIEDGDWKAAAWWLERRRPQDWRPRPEVAVSVEVPPFPTIRNVIAPLSPELVLTLDAGQREMLGLPLPASNGHSQLVSEGSEP